MVECPRPKRSPEHQRKNNGKWGGAHTANDAHHWRRAGGGRYWAEVESRRPVHAPGYASLRAVFSWYTGKLSVYFVWREIQIYDHSGALVLP